MSKLDELVELAALVCEVSTCMVSLVEAERQCFISKKGTDLESTAREISFCGHAILGSGTMIVENALTDDRFADNPLVTGECGIRFYAGTPLTTRSGYNIGTLCVVDRVPRTLTTEQKRGLEITAHQVVNLLELHRAYLEEIEQRRRLEESERANEVSEELFYSAVRAMHDGFVLQGDDGRIVECNERACAILGLSEDELTGRSSIDPTWRCVDDSGRDFPGERHPAMIALRTGEKLIGVPMGVHRTDGTLVWIKINAVPILNANGGTPKGVLCTFADVTEQRYRDKRLGTFVSELTELTEVLEAQRDELSVANVKLHRLADMDSLTGLDNHRSLHRILEVALQIQGETSFLLIDVDHFKSYNDTYGHPAGDLLLKRLSGLMAEVVRPLDTVCRYGGEEFGVILPGANESAATAVADRLLAHVRAEKWPLRAITVSIGVATASQGSARSELIEAADAALYKAKHGGRDRRCVAEILPDRKCS